MVMFHSYVSHYRSTIPIIWSHPADWFKASHATTFLPWFSLQLFTNQNIKFYEKKTDNNETITLNYLSLSRLHMPKHVWTKNSVQETANAAFPGLRWFYLDRGVARRLNPQEWDVDILTPWYSKVGTKPIETRFQTNFRKGLLVPNREFLRYLSHTIQHTVELSTNVFH